MGGSSKLYLQMQEELLARVEMPFHIYKRLKDDEEFEQMRLLGVKDTSIDFKSDKRWTEANNTLKESAIKRKEIEEQIRVEKSIENETRRDTR